jgi:diguanylate cyclase (GGDEF)-like protein
VGRIGSVALQSAMPARPTILIVDDVPANIRLLVRVLAADYEIVAATGGREALRIAEHSEPSLILLDVEMPETDGYEVCRSLQASPLTRDIPVIFVTGRNDEADEIEGLGVGAVDYITKPFSEAIVRARVRTHIELKRYRDLLRDRSYQDGLTGIANRLRFDEFLVQQVEVAAHSGRPLALILADVDHFKRFNDRYGHLAGDDCLRQVASAMRQGVRAAADLVARYGGEEFVCVLPEADAETAAIVAERLRLHIAALAIPHLGGVGSGYVSLSLGVAHVAAGVGTSVGELLSRADRALYRAKEEGRDRVCID